jgi:hypothetical protein
MCRKRLKKYCRTTQYFFKLQLSDVSNDTIGELQVNGIEICGNCTRDLKNTNNIYYIDYISVGGMAPKWDLKVDYKLNKVIFNATQMLTIVNSK